MAEILIKAQNPTHTLGSPSEDEKNLWFKGYPVVVRQDGWEWGTKENLPRFVIIKIPTISVEKVEKYVNAYTTAQKQLLRRRLWQVQVDDLPLAARQKLANTGELVIAAGTYDGPSDYTWSQIRSFFKRLDDNTTETGDL